MSRSRRLRLPVVLSSLAVAVAALAVPTSGAEAATVVVASAAAADPGAVWTAVDAPLRRSSHGDKRRVDPSSYAGYHLDLPALQSRLGRAPSEAARSAVPATISVPSPDGDLVEFAISESPIMQDELAAAHPDIATYAGRSTDADAPASIRLDVTPMGFHASVRSAGGGATWYVDPAYNGLDQGADALYVSYRGDALPERERTLTEPDVRVPAGYRAPSTKGTANRIGEGQGAVAIQRTYRLALVTDPSYATYFTTSTDQNVVNTVVTAEKVTLMNRVNQVYGDDFSIKMLLVNGNDALNFNTAAQFTGANGRCGNVACYTSADIGCGNVIDTNRFVVGQIIGADKYDIGHIMFGPDGDGGGVAYLGAVGTDIKAGGCTGLNPPVGDGFAVDYVAHEMGHQFAGNHTFNGTSGSCSGTNRNAGTSVEPGSGISVMAYAGICGVDNLQPHSDPYFSQRSQTEVAAFTRSAPANLQEIQNIALSGFTTTGESFTISYGGATTSTVTVGTNYTAAGLKTALEAAEPSSATATVVGSKGTTFGSGTNGFQVTWSGTADIPTPTVTLVSGTFTSIVGTYDNGGPEGMNGFNNPAPTGNHNPTVTAPAAKTIPQRTPFELTGSATDPDGDALVYLWEQNNQGATVGTALNSNTKTSGPLFRIFGTYANVTNAAVTPSPNLNAANTSPTRTFPDIAQVLAGETNAATGSCPAYSGTGGSDTAALRCFSEFLPVQTATTRSMSFRLTARDLGGPDGGSDGGTSSADTAITVGTAGPFAVTSQSTASTVSGNGTGTVTWNVASTNTATYATNVKISFTTNGGASWTTLVASTPNDGSESVTWPNVSTTTGRIKVEAVDNYFFDTNDGNITITPVSGGALTLGGNATTTSTFNGVFSDPLSTTPTITASSTSANGSAITATPTGLPTGLSLTRGTDSANGTSPGTTSFTVTGTVNADPGTYPVQISVSDGVNPAQVVSFGIVVGKDAATVTYTGDTSTSANPTGTTPVTLSATVADTDATPGTVAGTVAFTDQTTSEPLCSATVTSGTASCTYQAAAVTRTYQVVSTLTSTRYTGASSATPVTVTLATVPTLTTGGTANGGSFTAASSDALSTTATITASASEVDGSAITMTASGLPNGLSLTRTSSSATGTRPGTTQFDVTGVADDDPGTFPVTVTVSDGAGNAADALVAFTVTVTKDVATLTYTGDTSKTLDAGTTTPITLSATVADTDATPATVAGSVAFTDQTTGEALCSAAIGGGVATCTYQAAAASRFFQVVGTLTSTRYTGTSGPSSLVATVPTLTTGGTAGGATFTAASSDALSSSATVSAEASAVNGATITMTASGLPTGLTFTRTSTSSAGVRPGTTTYTVGGVADADPGSYPVTVAVSDGAGKAADTSVSFTVTVMKDDATLTYTGDTAKTAAATGTTPVTLSVTVADTDATPGTPAGSVAFTDQTTGEALCSAAIGGGTATCSYDAVAEDRTLQVVGALTSTRYQGSLAATPVVITVEDPADTTAPETTITSAPGQNSFVLDRNFSITYESSEAGSTYTCTFGTYDGPCLDGAQPFRSLKPGSYEFTIAAIDTAGNTDPTPATRRFSVPVNDRSLAAVKGPWRQVDGARFYRETASTVSRKGATLTYRVTDATSLALVLTKAPGLGPVDVYLGGTKLRTIRGNAGSSTSRVLAAVQSFGSPRSGVVTIVTTTGKPVKIEGLAVRTAY